MREAYLKSRRRADDLECSHDTDEEKTFQRHPVTLLVDSRDGHCALTLVSEQPLYARTEDTRLADWQPGTTSSYDARLNVLIRAYFD